MPNLTPASKNRHVMCGMRTGRGSRIWAWFARTWPFLVIAPGLPAVANQLPVLVPAPQVVTWSAEPPASLSPDSVAIVIGHKASDPEQQAARLLAGAVSRRFGRQWPILREGQEQGGHRTLVILGQRNTCQRIDELCGKRRIELGATSPGHDGYVIDAADEGDRLVVLVGGCNARGVEYGQDTLFQMLRSSGKSLTLVRGNVRDAPVIPWRGRPQTTVGRYLRPGELDLYVLSRVNFIDLRGGIYAFEPGEKLNRAEITEAAKAAHLRGLIVYATVNCGVPARDHGAVLGTFRELLDLGADGLWLSFDDKGPGEDPVSLVNQILELGRSHQIAGHLIAITPPKGSYQKIVTEFNRKIMAVTGMAEATWFWTGVPSAEALAEARSIGLKAGPGWWHNWPRLFTHHAYVGVPPLSLGWHAAEYDVLAEGGQHLGAVMPWGGNALGRHYVAPVIDWWGWNPAGHEWNALRHRIYDIVFGENQASAAMKFDDGLSELFGLFRYSYKATDDLPSCPPRLSAPAGRQAAEARIAEMSALLREITRGAPQQTLLPAEELKTDYLDPMRQELEIHASATGLTYPEDWWPAEQHKVLDALYAGDTAHVDRLMSDARDRLLRDVDRIGRALPSYPQIARYVDWWRGRARLNAKGWAALIESRRRSLGERVAEYDRQIVNSGVMLDQLREPPLEWGIGRWQVSNRVLATVLPSPNEWFWGDWMAGLHEQGGIKAAVFAADRRTPGDLGEYAELHATVPLSGHRNRLGLLLFVSSTNKDLFSNTLARHRWAGYRFIELIWEDKVLWEADLGQVPERGEWFMVRLPQMPADLKDLALRVRVEDCKLSLNNYTLCFVGPIRLMELPE